MGNCVAKQLIASCVPFLFAVDDDLAEGSQLPPVEEETEKKSDDPMEEEAKKKKKSDDDGRSSSATAGGCVSDKSDDVDGGGRRRNRLIPSATHCRNFSDLYRINKQIGSGSFGTVYECSSLADPSQHFACKTISGKKLRDKANLRCLLREVRILESLSAAEEEEEELLENGGGGYITKLYEVIEDEEQNVHLVMELCAGGNLQEKMKRGGRYREGEAARMAARLLRAVGFCHSRGVMHRDIKPGNVLFAGGGGVGGGDVRLADFGLSLTLEMDGGDGMARCRSRSRRTFWGEIAGTPGYVAPEMLRNEAYSYSVDVWSLGTLVYILLSGYHPFYTPPPSASSSNSSNDQYYQQQQHQQHQHRQTLAINKSVLHNPLRFSRPPWDSISQDAQLFIRQMLCPSPSSRITISQALLHPWILRHTFTSSPKPIASPSLLFFHGHPAPTQTLHRAAAQTTTDHEHATTS